LTANNYHQIFKLIETINNAEDYFIIKCLNDNKVNIDEEKIIKKALLMIACTHNMKVKELKIQNLIKSFNYNNNL